MIHNPASVFEGNFLENRVRYPSLRASDFNGATYKISIGKEIRQTNLSALYLCSVCNTDPTLAVPFLEGVLKRSIDPKQTESFQEKQTLNRVILDEIKAYQFLTEEFGEDFSWTLLNFIPLADNKGQLSLVTERVECNLRDYYEIKSVESKGAGANFKERLDDFIYICWLMNIFHQKKIPIGDVNLSNLVKFVDGKIAFIDFSLANQSGGLGKNTQELFATGRYLPKEVSELFSTDFYAYTNVLDVYYEKIFTNITLDIYALVCLLFELLTSQLLDYELMGSVDDDQKKQEIGILLENSPGLLPFLEVFLENYLPLIDVKQIGVVQQVFTNIHNFISSYFNQTALRQLDNTVVENIDRGGAFSKELNVAYIAKRFLSCFGLPLVTNYDPRVPWTINWGKRATDALEER